MRKNLFKIFVLIIILFLFEIKNSNAQNSNDALRLSEPGLGFSARALGMGNSFSAISDDYSAVFFNPAGLGLIKKMEIAGGLQYSKFNNKAAFFGNETDYSNSSTNFNQFSFVFPVPTVRGSLVFGLGYSKVKDFNNALSFEGFNNTNTSMIQELSGTNDVSYSLFLTDANGNTPINGNLNQRGYVLSKGKISKWAFSGAVEVAENVFVGATLNIISGNYNRDREYYEEDIRNVYQGLTDPTNASTTDFRNFYLNDILDLDLSGWDANFGLLYQFENAGRVGFNLKTPSRFTIKEKYITNAEAEFASTIYTLDPPFESEIEYAIYSPFEFSGGASFTLQGLILSGSLTYIDYTQMEFDQSGDLGASLVSANNKDIKSIFRGVLNTNLGAEFTLPGERLRLRGGFIYNPSPYKNDPSERDKKYLTAGLGFLTGGSFAFDVGYAYGWWKDIGDNYSAEVSRTFQDIKYHNLVFTVSHRF